VTPPPSAAGCSGVKDAYVQVAHERSAPGSATALDMEHSRVGARLCAITWKRDSRPESPEKLAELLSEPTVQNLA
jgi:hypothetical protein